MSEIETDRDLEDGNTNPQISTKKKQVTQLKQWFFTFNNYTTQNIRDLETKFKEICIKYIFQEETGENGTKHLQGNIWLKKKMRWTEFNLPKTIHWEKTRNEDASFNYCQKTDTRTGNIYSFGFPKPIKIIEKLKPWQEKLEQMILNEEPDGRTVYWRYDKTGGVGKSSFCKYMYIKHGVITIQGGKMSDIMNIIFNLNMDDIKAIIIDIPRCHKNHVSYASIECILTGMITNTKYETGTKVFNPPHVVVFSNFYPEIDLLSSDRWKIKEITN